jgi:hypothetical protein
MISDAALRRRLTDAGAARVEPRFSQSGATAGFLELYRNVARHS